jgi:rare lipoprotein A
MPPVSPDGTGHIDHSGRNEKGRVSYYASSFANKTMANGRPMDPHSNVAASKTLPLGSTAKVTNLQNGKTATVRIEDRGPYVKGRVVDVSPKVADQLDLKHQGVASAVVKPITVPQPDGAVKLGAGAATASPEEIKQATQITKQLTGQSEAAEK